MMCWSEAARRWGPCGKIGPRGARGVGRRRAVLCGGVAEQKPVAFELLAERSQERAYRIAWSIVRDREEAKDCSQDAFIRLHEAAGSVARPAGGSARGFPGPGHRG